MADMESMEFDNGSGEIHIQKSATVPTKFFLILGTKLPAGPDHPDQFVETSTTVYLSEQDLENLRKIAKLVQE